MSAIRVPLLCAFVGGCLSGAILLGVWRADMGASVPAPQQPARSSEIVTASLLPTNAEPPRQSSDDPPRAPSPAEHGPSPSADPEVATPAGSAVSDILTDLEAAYRQRLIAAARAEARAASEDPSTPTQANAAIAQAETAREVAARAPAPVAPVAAPAVPPAPAAVAPTTIAAAAVAPAVIVPPVVAAPAPVAQNDARPADIHIGDINNTYVTNVRQGDVYLMQQQIAMMQYIQLLGASPYAGAGRPGLAGPGAHAPRGAAPQYRQFPSTITNPDNPWGFNFAPPNLVH
ncbi:MAG: hypothetical protein WDO74_08370 [Pseudomonadota bacterium]